VSKKLELNGLWESSRMMLPQHKEAAIKRKESQRILRPIRDEQEIQNISAVLSLSQIRRDNGQAFGTNDISDLEEAMHWALSFVTGRHVEEDLVS
jgi:hypothetical protein